MSGDRPSYRSGAKSSPENSDDGEEDTPLWRQKQEKYFRKQKSSPMVLSSSLTEVTTDSAQPAPKKKSNNIWGSVLTEQDLTQTLSQSAAVDKSDEISYNERNVESYDFTKKYQDKRRDWDLDDSENPSADNITDVIEPKIKTESRPLAGRSIIGYEDTLDKYNKETRDLRHNISRPNNRKRRADDSNDRHQRSSIHDRLGVKKVTTTRLGEIDVSVDMEDSVLTAKIAEFLHEPKVELIERIVMHMGKAVAIKIMQATKDVEESGGMYTLDGSRRRTPGGVYLTLMKQQPEFNKDVRKLIFVEDVEEMMKHRKEKRKKAKKRNRAKKRENNSRSRSNSHSRSRSNSSSKSTPSKEANASEAMEEGEVKDEPDPKNDEENEEEEEEEIVEPRHTHKNENRNQGRKSRKDESSDDSSDEYDDDRQKSSWSKPFNFEDELEAAKKLILEKSKSQNEGDNNEMEAGNEGQHGQGQEYENFSEMADLETAEANVVDIEIGIDATE